jgi:hypothetical protein
VAKQVINKSEKIREELKANPQAMPAAIVEALKIKGITVTASLVSQVKSQESGRLGRRKSSIRKPKGEWSRAIEWLADHPRSTLAELLAATGVRPQAAYQARSAMKAKRARHAAERKAKSKGNGFVSVGDVPGIFATISQEGISFSPSGRVIPWAMLANLQQLANGDH